MDLPPVGLGTMGIDDPTVVERAIEIGYRHLDTAQIYKNEAVVGRAIAASDVPREKLCVATKVWASDLAPGDVIKSTHESLNRLGLECVDLLYIHRPIETYHPEATLPAFDRLRESGATREVGVSNFELEALRAARDHLDAPIAANQVEFHPLYRPTGALDDAREYGYHLVAYAPLAAGAALNLDPIREIAETHDVSPAAITLAWLLAKDVRVIPKASTESHLRTNLAAVGLSLSASEIERIDAIDRREELFPE